MFYWERAPSAWSTLQNKLERAPTAVASSRKPAARTSRWRSHLARVYLEKAAL